MDAVCVVRAKKLGQMEKVALSSLVSLGWLLATELPTTNLWKAGKSDDEEKTSWFNNDSVEATNDFLKMTKT